MLTKQQQQQRRKPRRSTEPCYFCVNGTEPDYKDLETLGKYLSSKQRIISRMKTGVCQKHQKRLTVQIKRARHLAMLPFVQSV